MNLSTLPLAIRTIRHLRASQFVARANRMLDFRKPSHRCDSPPFLAKAFPDVRPIRRPDRGGAELFSDLRSGRLRLLNETRRILHDGHIDWRLGEIREGRLWAITMHYHQWLYELARFATDGNDVATCALRMLYDYQEDWLSRCDILEPAARPLAWNSYAIATRLSWSIRSLQLLNAARVKVPDALRERWLTSLWNQAEFLHNHLEWDLRANHLLRDAVGLAWAGRFFCGRQPARWLNTATRLAVQQANEQVLADGGHFERSPMYHVEVMKDFQMLEALLVDPMARHAIHEVSGRMHEYIGWLVHPDGRIAQFNDGSAESIVASPRSGGRYLGDVGIMAWHGDPWTIFFDVGEIGPGCQPGHAHADTLTIDCSVNGQRLFVDPGCHSYDDDPRRKYDRSTAAHNTVCIDDTDSSEMWHIFRVGRRAKPRDVRVEFGKSMCEAFATHTGYDHLPGRPRHARNVRVKDHGQLEITDRVSGSGNHAISGGFLLSPQWHVKQTSDGWKLASGNTRLDVTLRGSRPIKHLCQIRPLHPDYGVEVDTYRLAWQHQGELPFEVQILVRHDGALTT